MGSLHDSMHWCSNTDCFFTWRMSFFSMFSRLIISMPVCSQRKDIDLRRLASASSRKLLFWGHVMRRVRELICLFFINFFYSMRYLPRRVLFDTCLAQECETSVERGLIFIQFHVLIVFKIHSNFVLSDLYCFPIWVNLASLLVYVAMLMTVELFETLERQFVASENVLDIYSAWSALVKSLSK